MIELSKTTFDKKRPHAVPVHYFGDLASIARANADVLAKLQEVGKTNGYEDIFIIATSSTGFLSVIVSAVKNGRIFIAESDSAIAVDKMTNGFVASTVIDTLESLRTLTLKDIHREDDKFWVPLGNEKIDFMETK